MRLNAYTVTIELEAEKTAYENSFLNNKDNLASNNIAIKGAIRFLETLNNEQYIGILITRQEMFKSGDKYIGSADVSNTYSHIQNDKENWVTVGEALEFLKSL